MDGQLKIGGKWSHGNLIIKKMEGLLECGLNCKNNIFPHLNFEANAPSIPQYPPLLSDGYANNNKWRRGMGHWEGEKHTFEVVD
jgi:hypothetical protein